VAARSRLTSIQASLAGLAARMPASESALTLYQRDRRHGGSVLAAGLAFRVFLMLLPFALLVAAGLGFLATGGSQAVAQASKNAGITGVLVGAIAETSAESRGGRWVLLVAGFVLLLYTLNGVYRALLTIHALAWQEPRPRLRLGSEVLVALAVVLLFVAGAVTSMLGSRFPAAGVAIELLVVVVTGAAWLAVSWLLPHRDAPWQALLPGAIAVAVGVGVLHLITVLYIPHKLSSTSKLYGSLGAAATLMSWLFLTCRLIVAAAALNASLWERGLVLRLRGVPREPAAPQPGADD
jgi:uncharacterized BrkB/YihY/UPF0761 family membrane protein